MYCFAAPVDEKEVETTRTWLKALDHPDAARDRVLEAAGIQIGIHDLQRTRDGRLLVLGFDSPRPEYAFPVLEGSDEPWTKTFWAFLQRATPFHPEPVSPLVRLIQDAAPSWRSLRDDLLR